MSNRAAAPEAKITVIGIMALVLLASFAYPIYAGGAHSPDEILGKWEGAVESQNISVTLEVMTDGALLRYVTGRRCKATADFSRLKGSTYIYRFNVKHGESLQGWCRKLRDEIMELTGRDNVTLDMDIIVQNEKIDETVNLTKEE